MARRKKVEEESDEIFVKVAKTGGISKEICLNGERTVEDALSIAEIEYDSKSRLRVNGEPVELDDELEDGDVLTVSGKIKGGKI